MQAKRIGRASEVIHGHIVMVHWGRGCSGAGTAAASAIMPPWWTLESASISLSASLTKPTSRMTVCSAWAELFDCRLKLIDNGTFQGALALTSTERPPIIECDAALAALREAVIDLGDGSGRISLREGAYCEYPTLVWRRCQESRSPYYPFRQFTT